MPKILYRYRALNQFSLSELVHGEFYFSSPSNFNDPFDCKNMFCFDGATDDHWRMFLDRFLQHNNPHISAEQRRIQIDALIATGEHRNREKIALQQNSWGEILTNINNGLGVVCLSSKRDDILMWSHYGDCHKGFCLAFNAAALQANFYWEKVTYKKNYPTFGEFVMSDFNEISRSFLFTKSGHWRYESEYRLLVEPQKRMDKPGERLFQFPPNALVGVIFGCQMPEKERQTVHEIVARRWPKATFSETVKSSNSYALKIRRV